MTRLSLASPDVSPSAPAPLRVAPPLAVVVEFLERAHEPRGNGIAARKLLSAPQLGRRYRRASPRASKASQLLPEASRRHTSERLALRQLLAGLGGDPDYSAAVWRYASTIAWRALNDFRLAGFEHPAPEQLADALANVIAARCVVRDEQDGRGPGLTFSQLSRVADGVAEHALRDWSPQWIDDLREAGRKGGTVSRRGPTMATNANLAALAALPEGLPRAEQAEALGVSVRTIARLRQQLRYQPPEGVPNYPIAPAMEQAKPTSGPGTPRPRKTGRTLRFHKRTPRAEQARSPQHIPRLTDAEIDGFLCGSPCPISVYLPR